jgi:hypothetical protein
MLGRGLPLDINSTAVIDLEPECCLCIVFAAKESNIGPRSRVITASNQYNFFHLLDPQSKPSGEGEPTIDMLHDPRAKITLREGIFTSSLHREG